MRKGSLQGLAGLAGLVNGRHAAHTGHCTKYKNIKSVAHRVGHSFLSDTNARVERSYWRIVPEALFGAAARIQAPEVEIDFLQRTVRPAELADEDVQAAVAHSAEWLPKLLASQNVEPAAIASARLTLTFDLSRQRSTLTIRTAQFKNSPVSSSSPTTAGWCIEPTRTTGGWLRHKVRPNVALQLTSE